MDEHAYVNKYFADSLILSDCGLWLPDHRVRLSGGVVLPDSGILLASTPPAAEEKEIYFK